MPISIRREQPRDHDAIRALLDAAFAGSEESTIVGRLRDSGALVLSLVAVEQERDVVGHIAFSPTALDTTTTGRRAAVGLAPLGVLPRAQRQGVGAALVGAGLANLARLGARAAIVLGDPAYYARFGFQPAARFGLRWEVPGHDDALQALELVPGALADAAGVVRYRPELTGYTLRPARAEELEAVQELEVRAAARFRASPHPHCADLPPVPRERLAALVDDGGVWLACAPDGQRVGFVALEPRGADLYVIELDVVPERAGARLGAALLDHAALVARRRGRTRLTLRTFEDVPWNAPYYRRLGFRDVDVGGTHLDDVARAEAAAGMDLARRATLGRAV